MKPLHPVGLLGGDLRAVGEGREVPEVPGGDGDDDAGADLLGLPALDEVVEEERSEEDGEEERGHVVVDEAHPIARRKR